MNESNRWDEFNSIVDTLDLDVKEKGLLLIIFRYVNHKTGYANPSRTLLKKLYGTNKNDVIDRVINSLINKGYLYRESGKGIRSKYFLKLGTQIEPSTKIELNTKVEPILGTKREPIVGTKIEPQKENKKKIKENNIYNTIFDFWISKNIKKHRTLTSEMKKNIDKTLKEYSKDEILEAINNYGDMYNDLNYQWCNYQWGLDEFLVRRDKDSIRQLGLFLNDGSKYLNYKSWSIKNNPSDPLDEESCQKIALKMF
ncbi:helix-turn-helix domain-containing protein [Clostridium paraputrificum]|uniref:helix-turn-helix domain-containing protein n=1 Tax=Clostridium paraputrificum TaxID=29363 RepID=UPI0003F524C4|nr:helix-turn-helix domain-containing protein [Clostridium paraputrificum]